jgi:uncharacterized protein
VTDIDAALLVVAKAPVPGQAKTRLAATIGDKAAAEIAAAALLDTLDAVAGTPVSSRVVALTGDLTQACRSEELRKRLNGFTVVPQRGGDFAHRLANAHADATAITGRAAVFQIGMDTPQVTPLLLTDSVRVLVEAPAVLGPATDGGWWGIGLRSAKAAQCLRGVPTSRSDTGALTLSALRGAGVNVLLLGELRDVDTADDVDPVRAACPRDSRFRRATEAAGV